MLQCANCGDNDFCVRVECAGECECGKLQFDWVLVPHKYGDAVQRFVEELHKMDSVKNVEQS